MNMIDREVQNDKVFFSPGDVVKLNKSIPNSPKMYVVRKETKIFKPSNNLRENFLIGIRCRWFTEHGELQEAVFSTKDLVKI